MPTGATGSASALPAERLQTDQRFTVPALFSKVQAGACPELSATLVVLQIFALAEPVAPERAATIVAGLFMRGRMGGMKFRARTKWTLLFIAGALLVALILPALQPAVEYDERGFSKFRERYRREQQALKGAKQSEAAKPRGG